MRAHDSQMPKGWHAIKSVLLTEIRTAANFHLCIAAADALFQARLIGEGIKDERGLCRDEQDEAQSDERVAP